MLLELPATTPSDLASRAHALREQQVRTWALLGEGVTALEHVQTRQIPMPDFTMRVQFNPRRIISSAAKVDAKSIAQRPCFLCTANLPAEQRGVSFNGDGYIVLCNPFPILPEHFTVVTTDHRPQRIADSFVELLHLAAAVAPRYTVFYNGPKCGASAPDHMHFQAGTRGFMTIESEFDRLKGDPLARNNGVTAYACACTRSFIAFESSDATALEAAFRSLYRTLNDLVPLDDEPMMNVLCWFDSAAWKVIIFPRAKHRPAFYFAEGDEKLLLSPASVDLGGVCIMPIERDFHRLSADHITQMLKEVMLPPETFRQLAERLRHYLT